MKKRVFILLSTILCALVTISLVTVSIVGIFKNKEGQPIPEDSQTVDVGVGGGELTNDELVLNMIIGDVYSGSVLSTSNYTGTLLVANANGELVATNVGKESISVVNGSVVYTCAINVFEEGDGSQANPYNIVDVDDLIKLVEANQGVYTYYAQQCDLDLASYDSWAPIGKLTAPFIGSYNGNGYAVKNMTIAVTPNNMATYIDNAQAMSGKNGTMLTTGFFGFVGDPQGNEISEITNVSIVDASVDTTAIETDEVRSTTVLTQSYVGVLAGFVVNAKITGNVDDVVSTVSSTINSSIFCDDITGTKGAVSAFIGGVRESEVSGFVVKSDITAKNPGVVQSVNNGFKYYGGTIAGIAGRVQNANISDFTVELTVTARNYENTIISGAIGYITDTNTDNTIKNIEVNNLVVKLTTYSYTNEKAGIIAGAIAGNLNEQCVIENVNVNNAIVNAIGTGQVSGIIDVNYGTLKNSSVSGLFKGSIVAGVVNTNYGTVCYDDTFAKAYAVDDVKLVGQTKVGGVAVYNFGILSGAAELTQIKATLEWSIVRKDFDLYKNEFMMAGVAVVNAGDSALIENFYTVTFLKDVVNAGGVVGWFGSYTAVNGTQYEGGSIKNVVVNTSIRTIAGTTGITTYSGQTDVVGGVVAIACTTTKTLEIADISGVVSLNYNVSGTYGVNVYGVIVGKTLSNVNITSSDPTATIETTIFTNYSAQANQYVGFVVGQKVSGSVTVGADVKVIAAIIETANGATVGEIN